MMLGLPGPETSRQSHRATRVMAKKQQDVDMETEDEQDKEEQDREMEEETEEDLSSEDNALCPCEECGVVLERWRMLTVTSHVSRCTT